MPFFKTVLVIMLHNYFLFLCLSFPFLTAGHAMDYFTFEIDGKKAGYYEEEQKDGIIYSNALLVIEGNQYENTFRIKHQDGKISAYKIGDEAWIDFNQPAGVYPTSAILLVLAQMQGKDTFTYTQFHEGDGIPKGKAVMTRNGNRIVETVDGKAGRHVVLVDGKVIEYGWGGTAISKRVATLAEAKAGSPIQ